MRETPLLNHALDKPIAFCPGDLVDVGGNSAGQATARSHRLACWNSTAPRPTSSSPGARCAVAKIGRAFTPRCDSDHHGRKPWNSLLIRGIGIQGSDRQPKRVQKSPSPVPVWCIQAQHKRTVFHH